MEKIKKLLLEKKSELEKLQMKVGKSLQRAPEGSLILSKSNGRVQYYHKTEKTSRRGKYIPEKKKKLVSDLAQKDYEMKLIAAIDKDKMMIEEVCNTIINMECMKAYSNLSEERRKLVDSYIPTDEEYVKEWLNIKYEGKPFSADAPIIITERGERVRSKSEKMIADKLFAMNIPYRYEYPIKLKGFGNVYPDFTLLRVFDRKEFYLEHFGLMDNMQYVQNMILKINEYANSGIYLGKNLFATFETIQQPVNIKNLEKMLIDMRMKR